MASRRVDGFNVRVNLRDEGVVATLVLPKPGEPGRFDYPSLVFNPSSLDPDDAALLSARELKSRRYDRAAELVVEHERAAGRLGELGDDWP